MVQHVAMIRVGPGKWQFQRLVRGNRGLGNHFCHISLLGQSKTDRTYANDCNHNFMVKSLGFFIACFE
jgi:hypothetical protein